MEYTYFFRKNDFWHDVTFYNTRCASQPYEMDIPDSLLVKKAIKEHGYPLKGMGYACGISCKNEKLYMEFLVTSNYFAHIKVECDEHGGYVKGGDMILQVRRNPVRIGKIRRRFVLSGPAIFPLRIFMWLLGSIRQAHFMEQRAARVKKYRRRILAMMERKYYAIDEALATQAQGMWSFSDYAAGSKTAEYKRLVDKAYNIADKVAEVKEDRSGEAYALADRYARKLADYFNAESRISLMCPSVMIAGPANFPVKKKERQNRAEERNRQEYQEIQKYPEKIRKLLYGNEVIKSADKNIVEKLQEKLDMLQKSQEQMKAVNAYYRRNKTLEGCPGLSPEDIEKLKQEMKAEWHYQDKPYLSFQLSNNNQNIRATKERLERLKKEKEKGTEAYAARHFKVAENTEIMRLQLFFDGKPDTEVREMVKKNGFRWSPKNSCWQRQLTDNARYSLKCLIKQLDQMAG